VFGGGRRADEPVPEGAVLHFALRTSNTDEALERARAAGAVVTVEPKTVSVQGDRPLDFRIAFVRGLNGEIIEFFQNDEL
jgi:glyoxylase I family protein